MAQMAMNIDFNWFCLFSSSLFYQNRVVLLKERTKTQSEMKKGNTKGKNKKRNEGHWFIIPSKGTVGNGSN